MTKVWLQFNAKIIASSDFYTSTVRKCSSVVIDFFIDHTHTEKFILSFYFSFFLENIK